MKTMIAKQVIGMIVLIVLTAIVFTWPMKVDPLIGALIMMSGIGLIALPWGAE